MAGSLSISKTLFSRQRAEVEAPKETDKLLLVGQPEKKIVI